jgi:phenylalanyl-tRNA synthetase beta subunit
MRNNPPYMAWRLVKNTEFTTKIKDYDYPIFHEDELALVSIDEDNLIGTFTKVAPGLCIANIEIPLEIVEHYLEERSWMI